MSRLLLPFTPKKLFGVGITCGALSVLLTIGLAAYLSFFRHVISDMDSYLLLCIPAFLGLIAIWLWLSFYEVPRTTAGYAYETPPPPSRSKFAASQPDVAPGNEKLARESLASSGEKPIRLPASNTSIPFLPADTTQFVDPANVPPAAGTDRPASEPAYTMPGYGPFGTVVLPPETTQPGQGQQPVSSVPDTVVLPPETMQLRQGQQSIENLITRQLPIPEIPNLAPLQHSTAALIIREFIYPKEGKKEENSQDKLAYLCQDGRCRFAVADGVGSSFLPDEWAQILTNNFVAQAEDFKNGEEFIPWLISCSRQWYKWVDEQWIPIVQQRLGRYVDWTRDRARGAQATFAGCSFETAPLAAYQVTQVNGMTIGDAVLFHVQNPRPALEQWHCTWYPGITPEEFGPLPFTLATRSDLIEQAWQTARPFSFPAEKNDIILLTTDALAKWIVTVPQQRIPILLTMDSKEAFSEFVLRERREGTLELDDVTLLIIYLQ